MAIATAGEISAQRVILERVWQLPSVDQQFQCSLELRQVFAPLLRAFDVLLELAGTAEGSHEQPVENPILYSQVGIKFFIGTKPFHVSARFAGVEDGGSELVRQPHLEGQSSLQLDLSVEKMNRLRSRETQLGQDGFDLALEDRLNPGADGRGFAHGANVVTM
jgi:hypothetical protein